MSKPSTISTLSEFLLQAQTQFIVFDLGRGIRPLNNQTFFDWENQQAPCAYPRQGHAWFCIVFWNEHLSEDRYIWFVKLPLDENGLLIQAARDQFLEIIVTALGKELEHRQNKQAQLPENPYVFVPSQQQLADCNAHIRRALSLKRRDIHRASAYLKAPTIQTNDQAWQALSLQDIADFIVYPDSNEQASVQACIAANLTCYPAPVQNALFASLESVSIEPALLQTLIAFHQAHVNSNATLAALCLRAMSYQPKSDAAQYLTQLIEGEQPLDIETSVVIVGRYWFLLKQEDLLLRFLNKVALLDERFELFTALYTDLVKIPDTRAAVLSVIRSPKRTDIVSAAIGQLFGQQTSTPT